MTRTVPKTQYDAACSAASFVAASLRGSSCWPCLWCWTRAARSSQHEIQSSAVAILRQQLLKGTSENTNNSRGGAGAGATIKQRGEGSGGEGSGGEGSGGEGSGGKAAGVQEVAVVVEPSSSSSVMCERQLQDQIDELTAEAQRVHARHAAELEGLRDRHMEGQTSEIWQQLLSTGSSVASRENSQRHADAGCRCGCGC